MKTPLSMPTLYSDQWKECKKLCNCITFPKFIGFLLIVVDAAANNNTEI